MKVYVFLLRDIVLQFHCFPDSHENLRLCCHCICITAHNNEFRLYCLKSFFFWFHLCQVMAVKDLCSCKICYEVKKTFRLLASLQGRRLTFIPVASLQLMTYIARWKKQHGLDCRLSGFFLSSLINSKSHICFSLSFLFIVLFILYIPSIAFQGVP